MNSVGVTISLSIVEVTLVRPEVDFALIFDHLGSNLFQVGESVESEKVVFSRRGNEQISLFHSTADFDEHDALNFLL